MNYLKDNPLLDRPLAPAAATGHVRCLLPLTSFDLPIERGISMTKVSEIMTRGVRTMPPTASLVQAAQAMDALNIGSLPVCDGQSLLGLVTDRDIVLRGVAKGCSISDTPLSAVMSKEVCWCFEDQFVASSQAGGGSPRPLDRDEHPSPRGLRVELSSPWIHRLRCTWPSHAIGRLRIDRVPATHRVGAVELGAEWLDSPALSARYELTCHPFCHDDWARWTARLADSADEASGAAHEAPVSIDDRVVVLVVDDDEFACELPRVMVSALGYQCLVARGGHEAIACCEAEGPNVVLMDLEMPGVDGFEATRRLRGPQQAGRIAPCRILAHSSLTNGEAVRQVMLAGADAFLAKPVPIDTLRTHLRRWSAARAANGMASGVPS